MKIYIKYAITVIVLAAFLVACQDNASESKFSEQFFEKNLAVGTKEERIYEILGEPTEKHIFNDGTVGLYYSKTPRKKSDVVAGYDLYLKDGVLIEGLIAWGEGDLVSQRVIEELRKIEK